MAIILQYAFIGWVIAILLNAFTDYWEAFLIFPFLGILYGVRKEKSKDIVEGDQDVTTDKENKIKQSGCMGVIFAIMGVGMFLADMVDGFVGMLFYMGVSFALVGILMALIASSKAKKMVVQQKQDTDVEGTLDKF